MTSEQQSASTPLRVPAATTLYDSESVRQALHVARGTLRAALNPRQGGSPPWWFVRPIGRLNGGAVWDQEAVDSMRAAREDKAAAPPQ